MNKKANQHYQMTHKKIQDTFLALLNEKDLEDITVTEICRQLDISRGTFYVHYTDIYDLITKTERDMTGEMQRRFLAAQQVSNRDAFLEIFNYVLENRIFYRIYLERGQAMHMEEHFSVDDFKDPDLPPEDPRRNLSDVELFYHNEFFRAGLRTLLRCWFIRDCKESPEELFEILLKQYQYSNMAF